MGSPKKYAERMQAIVTPEERKIFAKLNTPGRVQNFLDRMPINFRQTHRSPRFALREKKVQCIEGALLAAAALAYHGRPPLLLDLRTTSRDEDHVVALFQDKGYWGAVSKTNHSILRFRDPVYKTVRELAMSYFHEYFWWRNGEKTLKEFSTRPFDLRRYAPEKWVTSEEELWWLAEALDKAPHTKILPPGMRSAMLRHASKIERKTLDFAEWQRSKKK